jgi:hypothetical protein
MDISDQWSIEIQRLIAIRGMKSSGEQNVLFSCVRSKPFVQYSTALKADAAGGAIQDADSSLPQRRDFGLDNVTGSGRFIDRVATF